jgi:hypothetical protein
MGTKYTFWALPCCRSTLFHPIQFADFHFEEIAQIPLIFFRQFFSGCCWTPKPKNSTG